MALSLALALWALLAIPGVRHWLERGMVSHMLIEIPALVVAGLLLGAAIPPRSAERLSAYNRGGVPGLLAAIFTLAFWLLPRCVDGVISNPAMAAVRLVTLPVLAGLPLALSWRALPGVGRAFVWANLVSMLATMGWLYLAAPMRLCNNYLVDQQRAVGWAQLVLALLIGATLAATALWGHPEGKPEEVRRFSLQ